MSTSEIRMAVVALALGFGPGAGASAVQTTMVSGSIRSRGTLMSQAVVYLMSLEGTFDLERLLGAHQGNVTLATQAAGVCRRTLHRWIAEFREESDAGGAL